MFELYETHVEHRLQRWHVRMLSRLHPELLNIGDEKDRAWAFWYAAAEKSPLQRGIAMGCTLCVGPALFAGAAIVLGDVLGWTWHVNWLVLAAVAAPVGAVTAAGFAEAMRGSSIRARYYRAMRIAGHDICGSCGYQMAGHVIEGHESRTCPECGAAVAPPRTRTINANRIDARSGAQEFRKAS